MWRHPALLMFFILASLPFFLQQLETQAGRQLECIFKKLGPPTLETFPQLEFCDRWQQTSPRYGRCLEGLKVDSSIFEEIRKLDVDAYDLVMGMLTYDPTRWVMPFEDVAFPTTFCVRVVEMWTNVRVLFLLSQTTHGCRVSGAPFFHKSPSREKVRSGKIEGVMGSLVIV